MEKPATEEKAMEPPAPEQPTTEKPTAEKVAPIEQATSPTSESPAPVTSKILSALSAFRSEERLVNDTAPGSSEAPGAFPGSGPDLKDEGDAKGLSPASPREAEKYTQSFAG